MILSDAPNARPPPKAATLTALIEDGLRRVVNVGAPEQKLNRVLPPVSAATGGLMPGIDLNETVAQQETEDLELAARLR